MSNNKTKPNNLKHRAYCQQPLKNGTDYGKTNRSRIQKDLKEIKENSNMLASSILTMKKRENIKT